MTDRSGDIEAAVTGRQTGMRHLESGPDVTEGIGFGLDPLQRPVALNCEADPLLAFKEAAHQGGSGRQSTHRDSGGRIGLLPTTHFFDQKGGCCNTDTNGAVESQDTNHMVSHE